MAACRVRIGILCFVRLESVIDGVIGQFAGEYDRQRSRRLARDEGVSHLFKLSALFRAELILAPTG
jgi:hypothetical protein